MTVKKCSECGLPTFGGNHKMSCSQGYTSGIQEGWVSDEVDVVDEDWLSGVSCNPDAPEECESCQ